MNVNTCDTSANVEFYAKFNNIKSSAYGFEQGTKAYTSITNKKQLINGVELEAQSKYFDQ